LEIVQFVGQKLLQTLTGAVFLSHTE